MKKLFISLSIAAFLFAACSGNKHDHNDGTHTHDDGSVHQNHQDTIKQEEFAAPADTSHKHDDHEHPHTH